MRARAVWGHQRRSLLLALTVALGCDSLGKAVGGSGGSGGSGGTSGGTLEPVTSVENDMLSRFNDERTKAGKPALVRDPGLDRIELWYTREMTREHHLGHVDANGRESEARARHYSGVGDVRCSEIVQWWGGTPSGKVHYDGFLASPPHHMAYLEEGIFNLGPTMHVGVAVVAGTGPSGTMFEGRSGSYAAATLCDRALVLTIDPSAP